MGSRKYLQGSGDSGSNPFFGSMVLRVNFLRLCGPAATEGSDSVLEAYVCRSMILQEGELASRKPTQNWV